MPKIEPFEKHTQQYEDWFENNKYAYQSEINAIKSLMPDFKDGICKALSSCPKKSY